MCECYLSRFPHLIELVLEVVLIRMEVVQQEIVGCRCDMSGNARLRGRVWDYYIGTETLHLFCTTLPTTLS